MRLPLAACLLAAVVGCSSSTPGTAVPDLSDQPTPTVTELPVGRTPLPLAAGPVLSPEGFLPPLQLRLPAGWSSTSRSDDGFDLARSGVTVLFLTPSGDTAAPALAQLRARAGGRATRAAGTVAGLPATGFDLTGASGELLRSPSGSVVVTATPGARVRVLGADADGVPLLVAVVVRDGSQWDRLLPQAEQLLAAVQPG